MGKPDLRLVPKPLATCPPQHRTEMRRALSGQILALGTCLAQLAENAGELGDSYIPAELLGMRERCIRLASRVEPSDAE